MKKRFILIAIASAIFLAGGCAAPQNEEAAAKTASAAASASFVQEDGMKVWSSGITDGAIAPKYGANGEVNAQGMPVLSLPLTIEDAPAGTESFAVYMDDPDAKPLAGYNWVHWMAVNIEKSDIPEDFSRTAGDGAVQGESDFGETGYGGPTPPDKDHTYVIKVYALDQDLPLKAGFSKNEFEQAITGHVLASAEVKGLYKK